MDSSRTTTMSPLERFAFQEVGNVCHSEVERLCNDAEIPQIMVDINAVLEDFIMMGQMQQQTPEEREPAAMVTRDLGMEPPQPIVVVHSSFGCPEDLFVQQVLTHFIPFISLLPEEEIASTISEEGKVLMNQVDQDDEHRVRLARRLTEITPEEIVLHRNRNNVFFLPFLDHQNDCLMRSYQQELVSPSCGQAIHKLHQVRSFQYQSTLLLRQEQVDIYANLFLLYALIMASAAVVYFRRRNAPVQPAHILKIIYSRPHLKQAIEQEMGFSIGQAPPLMQGIQSVRKFTAFIFVFMAICVLWNLISIPQALLVCILFAGLYFCTVLFWKPEDDAEACTCCCCGASPSQDYTTEAQACCKCCQGTGVCSPNCADCCNPDDDEDEEEYVGCCGSTNNNKEEDECCSGCCGADCCKNGCCCGTGGCCCCGGNDYKPLMESTKKIGYPRQEIYEGVPIQVV